MIPVTGSGMYRLLARLLPLKKRWNFLIKKYLFAVDSLAIPFYANCSIVIAPNENNRGTISDLILEGAWYLPEYKLVSKIRKLLPNNFVYVDVGSNIGTTVWLYAQQAGRIIAFEPIPHLAKVIIDSARHNRISNVEVRQIAIGNLVGELSMMDNDNSIVTNSSDVNTIRVRTSTLDLELNNEPRVDLIKIDVEGFEWNVLQGAEMVLRNRSPLLLVELHPSNLIQFGNDVEQILNFLDQLGYTFEYYLFLSDSGKPAWQRLVSRYLKREKAFESRVAFLQDINRQSASMVYHIFCEPAR